MANVNRGRSMRREILTKQVRLCSGEERAFSYFDTKIAPLVCAEVLNGEAYHLVPSEILSPLDVKTIYDVGSNVGASCVYWADCYPNAKIYAYEPCEDAYELLCLNTVNDKVEPYNIALGIEDGLVDLFHNVEDDVCNSLKNHKSHGHEKVVIERARRHINGPIDILKLDTEGCEVETLSDVEAWIGDIKVVYLEYHSEYARRRVDSLMIPTHTLWSSRATRPHRGNMCYVRTTDVPETYANWAIN